MRRAQRVAPQALTPYALQNERRARKRPSFAFLKRFNYQRFELQPPETMLPRDERLTSAEFTRVWESARPLRHPLLTVRAVRRDEENGKQAPARCAFVVSRKSGKACERNRIRRRVRECFRLSQARKKESLRGHSVIFLINATRADTPLEEWTRAFEELAPRIVREARKVGPQQQVTKHDGRKETSDRGSGPPLAEGMEKHDAQGGGTK